MANKSIIQSGTNFTATVVNANVTTYNDVAGDQNNHNTTEANTKLRIRYAGTASKLSTRIEANTVTATSTIRFRKNGANGNQVLTIGSSTTGVFSDTTNTDSVAAGDDINYQVVTGATGTSLSYAVINFIFEPTSSSVTVTLFESGIFSSFTTASTTTYAPFNGNTTFNATESNSRKRVKKAGTFKFFQVNVASNARTTTTTFRLRKNGANGNQTVAYGSGASGQVEDTTNSDTAVADNDFNYSMQTGTGTQSIVVNHIAVSFESTSSITFLTAQSLATANQSTNTYFGTLGGRWVTPQTSETRYLVPYYINGTVSDFTMEVTANTSTTCTATLRINQTDTSLTISVGSGATGWFTDTTNTTTIAAGDNMTWKMVVSGATFSIRTITAHITNTELFTATPSETVTVSESTFGHKLLTNPVNTYVTRFKKDASGVTNQTQDIYLPFTPKAIIVYSDGNNVDNTVSDHYQWIQGFSDGTNHSCSCISSDDADAISDTSTTFWDNSVFVRVDDLNNNNVVSRATCSFSTNKVTFTWAVNNTEATYIHIIAYGGSDITNVKVGSGQIGVSASGTKDYTGLGFNPSGNGNSVLFLLENWHTTANNNTVVGNVGKLSFGCAVSSTKRWCVANALEDAQDPSDTWRYYSDTICAVDISISGNVNGYADFSAWITDGFRLNWTETGTLTSTVGLSYLVINGGNWDAGTLTSPGAATGNVDTAVSVNSQPIRGLMITSAEIGSAFANTAMDNAIINVGATDGINNSVIAAIDEDAQATTDSYRVNNTTNIVKTLASNGAAFSTATFDSFSTNNFRLDWIVDGSQKLYGWVVVADEPTSQLFERNVNETAVSVSETLARIQYIFKTISEPSVSVSETLARIQYLIKTLSEPAITVDQTLARIATYVKPISETAITTNDSIVRLFLPTRTISEPSVSTNDSIARWISVSYTIGEPSISVNDSIQGALFYLRSISEGAISVNDTIARILTAIRAISDPSISTNDTIARIASYLRLISDPSVSINDAISRIPTYVKTISNEAAINTNDTIATLLAAVRTISDPSISVNDTIARIQTILKQISDPSISVNDSILAARLLTGLIIESRVKWYYSLLTRKIIG